MDYKLDDYMYAWKTIIMNEINRNNMPCLTLDLRSINRIKDLLIENLEKHKGIKNGKLLQ